jgi:lipopolysaccharide transport system permease protein
MVLSCWRNRQLVLQLAKREVIGRYKGSFLGLGWSFFNPLLMLAVYTLVFGVVFKARWGLAQPGVQESKLMFASVIFAGLIVHSLLADVLTRSPGLILSNSNYVTRVVFPLEVLSLVALLSAGFHALISLLVLLVAIVFLNGGLSWTVVMLPLIIAPFMLGILGVSWILASLGVYLRDVGQSIGLIVTLLMFLSPIFYPTNSVPEQFRWLLSLNPLTLVVEQVREVLIFGRPLDWPAVGLYALACAVVACAGFWWFQRTRKGFADVI